MPVFDWIGTNGERVLGSTTPRLYTRPLITGTPGPCGCGCALTPLTSYGFDVATFAANVLGTPLDAWERWLVIHAGEYLAWNFPRFRHILVIVARQNGKTWLLTVLALYWLFVEQHELVLSTSTTLDYAREAWDKGVARALGTPALEAELPPGKNRGVRLTNGEQSLTTSWATRWKIAASNRRGGRSLTVFRLIMDELREHDSWDAWNAAVPALNAVAHGQIWGISNQGDDRSVVLDSRRATALKGADPRVGIFEWSAPEGSLATDPYAIAKANPNAGRRISLINLVADGQAALDNGGEQLTKYLTEILCIPVRTRNPAVDAAAWSNCSGDVNLAPHRARTVVVFDVSIDGLHASAVAAALMPSGKVMLDVVGSWQGPDAAQQLRGELPALLNKIKPRVLGWFPDGPAAVVAADMNRAQRAGNRAARFPPRMKVVEISGETTAACMGFADMIRAGYVIQPDDAGLTAHVCDAERLQVGDRWRFTRRGVGHCDGAYAAAGAAYEARLLPPQLAPLESG